jgi:hypothetical protein
MPEKKAKLKYKVPKAIGAAIDLLQRVRSERQALASKAESMKEQENLLESRIFEMFKKSELEGARGKLAQASISKSDVPTIVNNVELDRYVLKTKQLDLFQRRLSVEACRSRWDEGVVIPGVTKFTKIRLHLTKRKK